MKKRVNWPVRILLVAGALFVFVEAVQFYAQLVEKQEIIDALATADQAEKLKNANN